MPLLVRGGILQSPCQSHRRMGHRFRFLTDTCMNSWHPQSDDFLYNVHICNRIMPKYASTCMCCILLRKAKFIQSNENDKFGCWRDTSLYILLLMHAYHYKIMLRFVHHFSFHSCYSYWILVYFRFVSHVGIFRCVS
jgi:hypothetical protein